MTQLAGGGDQVESAVRAEIHRVLDMQGNPIERVSAADSLSDTLGLTSIDLVELIVALNARLRVDPFRERAFTELRTVGDLFRAYGTSPAGRDPDAELVASRRRAEARRDRWRPQS